MAFTAIGAAVAGSLASAAANKLMSPKGGGGGAVGGGGDNSPAPMAPGPMMNAPSWGTGMGMPGMGMGMPGMGMGSNPLAALLGGQGGMQGLNPLAQWLMMQRLMGMQGGQVFDPLTGQFGQGQPGMGMNGLGMGMNAFGRTGQDWSGSGGGGSESPGQ